jgi:hypothetical protein
VIIKILDALRIVRGVYLESCLDGQIFKTWERRHPITGRPCAHVYPFSKIGNVSLNSDGTIDGHYCHRWAYMRGKLPMSNEVEELEQLWRKSNA